MTTVGGTHSSTSFQRFTPVDPLVVVRAKAARPGSVKLTVTRSTDGAAVAGVRELVSSRLTSGVRPQPEGGIS